MTAVWVSLALASALCALVQWRFGEALLKRKERRAREKSRRELQRRVVALDLGSKSQGSPQSRPTNNHAQFFLVNPPTRTQRLGRWWRRSRWTIFVALCAASAFTGCAGASSNMSGGSRSTALNIPELDLMACFPRTERDWGSETHPEAMLVAVEDVMPILNECSNNLFFRRGSSAGTLTIALEVQQDSSVSVEHETSIKDRKYRACVSEALAMIDLPRSSEPVGQTFKSHFDLVDLGDSSLTMNKSVLGTIIGGIRTRALDACDCLTAFEDSVPPMVNFKFEFEPNNPLPINVEPTSEVTDPALTQCLAGHLRSLKIERFPRRLKASYKFKFQNSRTLDLEKMLADAGELSNRGEHRRALAFYDEVLHRSPGESRALVGKGLIYDRQGRIEASLRSFKLALQHDPNSFPILYNIARSYAILGRFETSLQWLERSLEEEEDFRAYYLMSVILRAMGEHQKARRASRQACALNPHFAPAYVYGALAAVELGDFDEARELIEEATALEDRDPNTLAAMGLVFVKLEEPRRALSILESLDDPSGAAMIFMGIAHEMLGHGEKALEIFCQAAGKKGDPSSAEAQTRCDALRKSQRLSETFSRAPVQWAVRPMFSPFESSHQSRSFSSLRSSKSLSGQSAQTSELSEEDPLTSPPETVESVKESGELGQTSWWVGPGEFGETWWAGPPCEDGGS